jgi:phenylalanyl-tRNA synthetase alpha chain
MHPLSAEELAAALAVRDLTDPAQGRHALQQLADATTAAVAALLPRPAPLIVARGSRLVDVADNYDRLGYPAAAAARDARYTRYAGGGRMLRSQTSALAPPALRALAASGRPEALIACPGMVYRRDAIDRWHTGTPHQLDLWLITGRPPALRALIAAAVGAALPGVPWRVRPAVHPYTTGGLEIEAWAGALPGGGPCGGACGCEAAAGKRADEEEHRRRRAGGPPTGGQWVEIGECGVAARQVLAGAGLPPGTSGLAIGLGLDRLLMLRKGIDDIRLLRSTDPRVSRQLTDLSPYRPVSRQPAATRDLSIALPAGVTAEDLGDRVREVLGADAHLVEEVTIRSVTPAAGLPAAARERLAIRDGEVNVLLRVVLRDLRRTLPRAAANVLRDRIARGLTDGPSWAAA